MGMQEGRRTGKGRNRGRRRSEKRWITAGDGRTGGTEVLLTQNVDDKGDIAKRICKQMSKLGFANRGVKTRTDLYFLNHTKAPAILIEVCFVDDKDDYMLYINDRNAVVGAIVKSVLNHNREC